MTGVVVLSFLIGYWFNPFLQIKSMEDHREDFIDHKEMMIKEMMMGGNYKCCLEKPCVYCIEKTPGHGMGASCDCLSDVVNGKHPCGECMGEILEGHGNKYLKEYFPEALTDELGEEYLEMIKEIINKKYN